MTLVYYIADIMLTEPDDQEVGNTLEALVKVMYFTGLEINPVKFQEPSTS